MAPRAGLEPATNWLTVNCSTNWATEECNIEQRYFFLTTTQVFFGGHAQNRTGIQGFAILCVTIPPRGQVALWSSSLKQQRDFIHLKIISTSMKVDNKTIKVDQELTTEIDFNDKAINDLYIKKGNRKDFNFFKNF